MIENQPRPSSRRRLLDLARQVEQEAPQQPHRERQAVGHVDDDHAEVAVGEPGPLRHQKVGQRDHHARHEAEREDQQRHPVGAPHLHPRQRVGRDQRQEHRDDGGDDDDDRAVEDGLREIETLERGVVMLQGRIEGELRLRGVDHVRRLHRGHRDPVERREVDRDHDHRADIQESSERRAHQALTFCRVAFSWAMQDAQEADHHDVDGDHHQHAVGRHHAEPAGVEDRVDVHAGEQRGRAGPAPRDDEDHVEDADLIDQPQQQHHGHHGPDQRQHDAAQIGEAAHAVEPRGLDHLGGYSLHAGEQDERDEGRPLPDVDDHHREQRRVRVGVPQALLQAHALEQIVEQAADWLEHRPPGEPERHRRDEHRNHDEGSQDADAAHGRVEQHGEEEAQDELDRHRDGAPDAGEPERLPEGVVVEEEELEIARADPARRQRVEQVVAAERRGHGPAQRIDREPDQNEESRKDEEIRDPILAQVKKGLAAPPGGARQPWYSHAANA